MTDIAELIAWHREMARYWSADAPSYAANHAATATALEQLVARAEKAETALRQISRCESHHPGDVVSLARAALKGPDNA